MWDKCRTRISPFRDISYANRQLLPSLKAKDIAKKYNKSLSIYISCCVVKNLKSSFKSQSNQTKPWFPGNSVEVLPLNLTKGYICIVQNSLALVLWSILLPLFSIRKYTIVTSLFDFILLFKSAGINFGLIVQSSNA